MFVLMLRNWHEKTQYTKRDLYTFSAQFYTYINNFWSSLQGGQGHCRRLEGRQRHVIWLRPNHELTLGAVVQFYLRKKKNSWVLSHLCFLTIAQSHQIKQFLSQKEQVNKFLVKWDSKILKKLSIQLLILLCQEDKKLILNQIQQHYLNDK